MTANRDQMITDRELAHSTATHLLHRLQQDEFKGYDPFDGLNSPIMNFVSKNSKFLRLCVVQGYKLSPLNLRRITGVKKVHNAKTLALVLSGILSSKSADHELCNRLVEILLEQKSASVQGLAWGYNHDWQNRVFFIPSGTPTIVNTSFVGHALLDLYKHEEGANCSIKDMILKIVPFFTEDLNTATVGAGKCFSYTPIDHTKVHNANLLGVSLLCRISRTFGIDLDDYIDPFVEYALNGQTADGGWDYGSAEAQKWRDSFHTGFNLNALRIIEENISNGELKGRVEESIKVGDQHYIKDFFGPNGEPFYFNRPGEMYDVHTPAQAIYYFSKYNYPVMARRVFNWTMENMFNGSYFDFRKYRLFRNSIEYSRWSSAWMFYALSELANRA